MVEYVIEKYENNGYWKEILSTKNVEIRDQYFNDFCYGSVSKYRKMNKKDNHAD